MLFFPIPTPPPAPDSYSGFILNFPQRYSAKLRLSDLSHMFRLDVWNIWDWYTTASAVPKTLQILKIY